MWNRCGNGVTRGRGGRDGAVGWTHGDPGLNEGHAEVRFALASRREFANAA